MQVEGIILSKTLYKEKDLICHLLLRSGETLSVYFYGGKGGGKNQKGSILEVGFMVRVQLQKSRKKLDTNLQTAKEYSLIWHSDLIRSDYKAFCLSSFYLEFISKITSEASMDYANHDDAGLFKVLSNALYFLDDSLAKKCFDLNQHLFIYLSKMIIELGINPDTKDCLYCGKHFSLADLCLFDYSDGGFSCQDCSSQKDEYLSENKSLFLEHQNAKILRKNLGEVYQTNYKDYQKLSEIERGIAISLFQYINFQFEFVKEDFKTWSSL